MNELLAIVGVSDREQGQPAAWGAKRVAKGPPAPGPRVALPVAALPGLTPEAWPPLPLSALADYSARCLEATMIDAERGHLPTAFARRTYYKTEEEVERLALHAGKRTYPLRRMLSVADPADAYFLAASFASSPLVVAATDRSIDLTWTLRHQTGFAEEAAQACSAFQHFRWSCFSLCEQRVPASPVARPQPR